MDFSLFDVRKYPEVSVCEGYGEWVTTYEDTVQDEMDLRLLNQLQTVPWRDMGEVLDLACGTGRIGTWLKEKGCGRIDGIDLTPEMLAVAEKKRVYRRLTRGDVLETGLPPAAYDLAIQVLADEHLADLGPLYREAERITRNRGWFVIVGYHPYFLMNGVPTHYDRASGESVAIKSTIHLTSDQIKAGLGAGWQLAEMIEGVIDEAWISKKPKWVRYRHQPVSFAMVWRKQGRYPLTGSTPNEDTIEGGRP